jgi:hypothetical protein
MKTLLTMILLLACLCSRAQDVIVGKYIGEKFTDTKNKSYSNCEMLFVNFNNDTIRLNLKLPYDKFSNSVFDYGLYKHCILIEGNIYAISLLKICINDIPAEYESYYKYNAVADNENCSKFKEIEKNTNYVDRAKYGNYVDVDNTVYKVIGLTPDDDCLLRDR